MLLVMNGQRNRTDTAVLVQWPGHTMDGEHTSSDRQFCLVGSVFCNLFSLWRIFPSGRWVSQWCCTWFVTCVFLMLLPFSESKAVRGRSVERHWQCLGCDSSSVSCPMRAHASCCHGLSGIGRNWNFFGLWFLAFLAQLRMKLSVNCAMRL